ncbi:TIGR04283 family arsenosugar biosynthesis glycosyltransferase [Caldovatus aquaticus]|uniref:TIGR04283 family arsenosugar biosynthesis glycosyltransferase n=1 Tax=Caldovatus aquaticus TaxID=2865671 RepID=UPI0034E27B20
MPTLNAAGTLPATLAALGGAAQEVVVADGGSSDGTPTVAAALGARVLAAPRGRGAQLAAGAQVARGDWLLFLHADTVLAPGWARAAAGFAADPANAGRAAYFRFALDDPAPQARRLERLVAWRCRWLALPYGDQGLLIARRLYESLGGFRPELPLMEDVDLVRRLGRRRLVALDVPAVTSAARWRAQGWKRRSARNLACLALWCLGVPARRLAPLYGR